MTLQFYVLIKVPTFFFREKLFSISENLWKRLTKSSDCNKATNEISRVSNVWVLHEPVKKRSAFKKSIIQFIEADANYYSSDSSIESTISLNLFEVLSTASLTDEWIESRKYAFENLIYSPINLFSRYLVFMNQVCNKHSKAKIEKKRIFFKLSTLR